MVQVALFVLTFAFTFGIVGLWGLIEGIMILCKAKQFSRDASGVPIR